MTPLTPQARSVAVAAILVSLGRDRALRLLERFDASEIERLGTSAAEIGHVEQPRLDALTRIFERDFATGTGVLDGGRSFTSILAATRDEEPAPEPEPQAEDPWAALRETPTEKLAMCLSAEHPNVAAMTVRRLGAEDGGVLVQAMEPDARLDCLRAMVDIRPTPLAEQVALDCVTARLNEDGDDADTALEQDMAAMLSLMDAEAADAILSGLSPNLDDEALARIAAMVLRFEDLARLSDGDRARLTGEIAMPDLVAALSGVDADLSEAFLSTLGQRARKMAQGELQTAAITPDAADRARRDTLVLARRLAAQGTIALPSGNNG